MKLAFLTTACLIALFGSPEGAGTWYLINGEAASCDSALQYAVEHNRPYLASPAALEAELRKLGQFGGTRVIRDASGNIVMVLIPTVAGRSDLGASYFPSLELCETERASRVLRGILTDPKELR